MTAILRRSRSWLVAFIVSLCAHASAAAVEIPPPPATHVFDQAAVLTPAAASSLNARLDRYERETSTQMIIALFTKLPEGEALSDFTVRVFDAWKPGLKGKDNSLIIFGFMQSRKLWIQTGYGVEAKLPDSVCRRIADLSIAPAFKAGNYAGGLTAGLDVIEAALKGEYQGTGRTLGDTALPSLPLPVVIVGVVLLLVFIFWLARVGRVYGSRGIADVFDIIIRVIFYALQSGASGSFRSGGGGGFRGGGGRTGGGGAGGEW